MEDNRFDLFRGSLFETEWPPLPEGFKNFKTVSVSQIFCLLLFPAHRKS